MHQYGHMQYEEDWGHRNDSPAYKRVKIDGMFSSFNTRLGSDASRAALDLDDVSKNPYLMALGAAASLSYGMTGLMQDIEARIHGCPTAQLYALVMNRYNPEYSLSSIFGHITSSREVDDLEESIRERICHAAIGELENRMARQANKMTDWDIAGRLLVELPNMPKGFSFGDDDAARILGRLRLAYAWNIVLHHRPQIAPEMRAGTLYSNALDVIDIMPELEEPLKGAYPKLVQKDKPGRTRYFMRRSDEFMSRLYVCLHGKYGVPAEITEDMVLTEISSHCRAVKTDFDVEYGNFDADFWRGEPFPTKAFISRMWAALRDNRQFEGHSVEVMQRACDEAWADYDHRPMAAPAAPQSVPSANFLGDAVDPADAEPDDVFSCPSCGKPMYIGSVCDNCGYADTGILESGDVPAVDTDMKQFGICGGADVSDGLGSDGGHVRS